MRVIFDKTELSDAIDRVQRAAQAKITSNTNNGYFIAAENGKVELQANDYTIGIKTSCPAMIEEEGIIVIAASQLQSTIRMMPAGDIVMEKKKEEIWSPLPAALILLVSRPETSMNSRKSKKWSIPIMRQSPAKTSKK